MTVYGAGWALTERERARVVLSMGKVTVRVLGARLAVSDLSPRGTLPKKSPQRAFL